MHNSFILLFYCIWMVVRFISQSNAERPEACEYCLDSTKSDSVGMNSDRERKKKGKKKINKIPTDYFMLCQKCFPFLLLHTPCVSIAVRCSHIRCRRRCLRPRCSRRLLVPTPTVINLISVVVVLPFDLCCFFVRFVRNHNEIYCLLKTICHYILVCCLFGILR